MLIYVTVHDAFSHTFTRPASKFNNVKFMYTMVVLADRGKGSAIAPKRLNGTA